MDPHFYPDYKRYKVWEVWRQSWDNHSIKSVEGPRVDTSPEECENEVVCISYAAAKCLAAFPPPLISWTRSLSQCAMLTAWSRYVSPMCTAHTTPTCVTTWGRVEMVNGVNNFPQPQSWFLHATIFSQGTPHVTKFPPTSLWICSSRDKTILQWTHHGVSRLGNAADVSPWLPGIGWCRDHGLQKRGPRPNFVWRDFIINRDKDL